MSFNMNVNDDYYEKSKRNLNSGLQFGEMPQANMYDPAYYQPQAAPAPQSAQSTQNYYGDWSASNQFYNPMPQQGADPFTPGPNYNQNDFDNEPPLLEELGINFDHIFKKTKCVLNPFAKPHESIIHDEDLAGPLVFCIAYGFSLLLMGKIQFGYIYGITALGCLCMYSLLNLMSEQGVNAVCIGSTLGYCLLPMVLLSFLASFVNLSGLFGLIVSILFILWCSISSSKLFVHALNMSNQQILVLYPCFLLYGIFALLNIF